MRLGLGLNRSGLGSPQAGSGASAPAAPTLTLISGAGDNTPDFTLDGDLVVNDVVRFQYSTASDFTGASEITNTIDAGEDAANELDFSTGALADGAWYFRARIERPVNGNSAWSNTETETIDATAPTITSSNTANVAENTTAAKTITATDAGSGVAGFTITGGADAALFHIDPGTGVLTFLSAPDFESPADVGANNVYNVTVGVTDVAGNLATQAIAVTVTDIVESATWDTHGADITLSGGNLTAASTASGANCVRIINGHSTGKYFIELKPTAGNQTFLYLGLADSTFDATSANVPGLAANGITLTTDGSVGNLRTNGSYIISSNLNLKFLLNDIIGIAYDATNGLMWIRVNDGYDHADGWIGDSGAAGDPAAGTNGIAFGGGGATLYLIALVSFDAGNGASLLGNFGGSAHAYPAPTGFGNP